MITDVEVTIGTEKVIGTAGFGIPLILTSKAAQPQEYATYRDGLEVSQVYGVGSNEHLTAALMFSQNPSLRRLSVCADSDNAVTAIGKIMGKEWRQLVVLTGEDDSTESEISLTIEGTKDRMYFCTVSDKAKLAALKGRERTVVFFYDVDMTGVDSINYPQPVAAVVGAAAARRAGSFTYKNLIIKGLEPVLTLSAEDVQELHENGGITLLEKAGDIVTSEGITTSGDYIDLVDGKDFIISNIEYSTQKLLNVMDKVKYTDVGISVLENATVNVLRLAAGNDIIAEEDGAFLYSTNFLPRSEMSVEERSKREYSGGHFDFVVAGAIHNAKITGELKI